MSWDTLPKNEFILENESPKEFCDMKKIFAILLALCLFASLLPMTVMAENPTVKISFRNPGTGVSAATVTVNPGDTAYVVTTDGQVFAKWEEADAPTDKYVKVEYPAEGDAVVNVTMKNIDYKNEATSDWSSHAIEFSKAEYKVVITLEGENKMQAGSVSCIKSYALGGVTITGAGKLVTNQTGSVAGTIWMASGSGDLLIKDTTLDMSVLQGNHSLHHAILSNSGNVTFDNVKITSNTQGGGLIYFGQPQKSGDQVGRYTPDPDDTRKLTIKDSEITATVLENKTIFASAAPAIISNSTLKLSSKSGNGPLISPAPTFEGDYTAIAGLVKNADKLDKLKVYDAKKLASYTYIYIVPGIQDLIPTEPPTQPTEPSVPEVTTPSTPDATTPSTPDTSTPDESKPTESKPTESKPATDNKPSESKPATNNQPDATDPAKGGKAGKNNTMVVVLIILIVVCVAVAGTFGVLFYLKKKKAQ